MPTSRMRSRISPAWWALFSIIAVTGFVVLCSASFSGAFRSYVPVTLTSDRSGLVMESGAKVKLRGIQVGRVGAVTGGGEAVSLQLEIDPDKVDYIPANVQAQIRATTVFGSKYVDLVYPQRPSPQRLAPGATLQSRNVSTEVNTVFQNLVAVLHRIDPAKLNAVLGAFAEGVRGQGERMGEALTDSNEVLLALNPRMDTVHGDFRSFRGFNQTYAAAAPNILTVLDAASTTGSTIVDDAPALDALLLSTVGFAHAGIELLGPTRDNLIRSINTLEPTTALLNEYSPEYTCVLVGGVWVLENGGWDMTGGHDGRSVLTDAGFLLGNDPYRYPDHLPVVAAKGGPGGKPGCGSLPDASKNFPVRYLVTDTGWGTGLDVRPNPGIGHPCWADYFPVTRAVPEPPSIRKCIPGPAIGPVPYPGAPPYGASLYAPDGTPLYPGVPPPPPAPPPAPGP
ncbi:MCE family protein [Mycobacterium sp. Y57]|uniref:MCE family protein n=1 Tax=Mycolicibacterium xanthum TaxID=2796469 RepID=UPI001C847A73|nr:MCE family protein [Mycolicibacterium xanthum]MBX7430523.1 MCE family protein [Mycolicibacterium xanthum]